MGKPSYQKCIMIVAGEASGDLHGSNLVRAIKKKDESIFFCGIGGNALRSAGVRILIDSKKLSVIGITEVISKMPFLLNGLNTAKRVIKSIKPDLLILIDFPDFNFMVAKCAKKFGIPILYYISPQVWAWRQGRVKKIKKLVDHLAVILPFEEDFFKNYQIPVTFVGHPLLDNMVNDNNPIFKPIKKRAQILPAIGLLPGSRESEILKLLPAMIDAANILTKRIRNIKFIVSLAPTVEEEHIKNIIKEHQKEAFIELTTSKVHEIFERCKLIIAASGTVTLEAAIACIPTIIIYKVSSLSYLLGKALIKVKHIGLINLIANEEISPELIQDEASPENIADTAYKMLKDPHKLKKIENRLLEVRKILGGPGASNRTADIAIDMMINREAIFKS